MSYWGIEKRIDQLWNDFYPQVLKDISQLGASYSESIMNITLEDIETADDNLEYYQEHLEQVDAHPVKPKRRFDNALAHPENSFKLYQSNDEISHIITQSKHNPELSHTSANLILLLRGGFTGCTLE